MTGPILVTGVAGFIGSNVARRLAGAGRNVVGCDRLGQGSKWRNLVDVGLHDLVTPEALPGWLARNGGGLGGIVHMGAISATTETDVDLIVRENVRATLDLWEFCARAAVPLIYASSGAVYGDGRHGFDDDPDLMARLRPLNAYGWSKLFVDRRIVADAAQGSTPPRWAGLRFFNVYGPGEDHKGDMRSVVAKLVPRILDGEPARLFRSYRADVPDGGQQRDFVHVGDVVDVILWLLDTYRCARWHLQRRHRRRAQLARSRDRGVHRTRPRTGDRIHRHAGDAPPDVSVFHARPHVDRLRAAGWNAPFRSLEDGVRAYVESAATA